MGGKRSSLIALSDVDQIFNDLVIKELAETAGPLANAELCRFAKSIRNDVRLFLEAKGHLNKPQLRTEVERLHTLNKRALRGDREAQQLARAVHGMHADVREWLARCNPKGRDIPTPAEISLPATRASAVQRLRLILSYGVDMRQGRKRPSGRRSRPSARPLLRIPAIIECKSKEGRPRGNTEREFVRNLALTYLDLTGEETPNTANYTIDVRGPFSRFVHRCFELVRAPTGNVTRLINERGAVRRDIEGCPPTDTNPFR
jgi:hypothetical protein